MLKKAKKTTGPASAKASAGRPAKNAPKTKRPPAKAAATKPAKKAQAVSKAKTSAPKTKPIPVAAKNPSTPIKAAKKAVEPKPKAPAAPKARIPVPPAPAQNLDARPEVVAVSEGRANGYLSQDQIHSIRRVLLSEKEKLVQKDRSLEQFCLDKNELSDVLDEASINIQASQELRFRNRETFYLKKINKGLDRIQRGTYGLCEDCDGEIAYERLLARPTAELCITCKEETEMTEKGNFFHGRSKSLGKAMHEMAARR